MLLNTEAKRAGDNSNERFFINILDLSYITILFMILFVNRKDKKSMIERTHIAFY